MLEVHNIRKFYGNYEAVKPLNFSLEKGEVLGLLGRNGAGKSTTIKMVLGLIPLDEGEVLWEGKPLNRKKISMGYLPEERGLYEKTSVYDQLIFFGQLEGMKRPAIQKSMDKWLERLEIPQYKHKWVSELSKGNKQKVQLIATLLHDPELIVLDEPFSGLDPVNANMFSSVISDLIANKKTILLSSHRMEQIERFCEHILMLKEGNTMLAGKLDDIKRQQGVQSIFIQTTQPVATWLKVRDYAYQVQDNGYSVLIGSDEDAVQLFHLLKESGFVLRTFTMKEPSLHDLFVERVQ